MMGSVAEISDYLLTSVLVYGTWMLGFTTLMSGIGFPLPATMMLIAAGAFVQQGVLIGESAVIFALLGAVIGDNVSYMLGRLLGAVGLQRVKNSHAWGQARIHFEYWAALSIFLSRFLVTPLALPINLMAGSTRYAMWRYAGMVLAGEILWVLIFIGIGYIFADRWEILSEVMSNLSGVFVGLVLLILSGIYLVRRVRRSRYQGT